ncbi:penicillin-binding protein 2 [Alcanivorax sp. 1008]|uniref:peptidoglycan D,D-transpeptidase FtsI family protein n=1 Tax=Alcanivorax sp. 1008 TaxID=2816853 RepID=UPI001D69100A|nr:penicillin-binding transpeptidase domain-containing protein [Alcanivorax sp. 1008]MCC1495266.1 penicillin-binding protein 2 [Alcanivorax sp. 1008]
MKSAQRNSTGSLRKRYLFMVAFWALLGIGLLARAVDLHIVQHEFLSRQGDMRNLRVEPLAAHRGVISDRHGRPLAVSTPVITLWANPREALESRDSWSRLNGNKVLDSKALAQRVLPNSQREFIYLSRHLAPEQAQQVLDQRVPGIYALTEYRRYYPAAEVTSHVVGFTNIDDIGQEGIELSFEEVLRGAAGRKRVVRDLIGRVIQDIEIIEEARPGQDVQLSIDLRLQYLAYRELMSAVSRHNASGGSVVVLDADTGEILAMVNQPGYNPNGRASLSPSAMRNRAVTDLFEPGSTLKTITLATALEAGMVTPHSMIDTRPGTIRVSGKTIRDHRNYGVMDITAAFGKSSNVMTTKLALDMQPQQLQNMLDRFGFGRATGIPFPGESDGVLPLRARWRDIEQATLSYGYGISVTALQLAQAYAVVANDGVHLPVSLTRVNEPPKGERVISAATAGMLVDMLGVVVSDHGTARQARVNGYQVGGKTGTVHKIVNGAYADDNYLSLFVGVAPLDNPRYVTVVVIDDPAGEAYYGGEVAAPVFSRVMEGVLRTLNVTPDASQGIWAGVTASEGRS